MANMTTTSVVAPAVDTYYDKLLLARARGYQIFNLFSQQKTLPAKNSDTVKYRRYSAISTATTPLTEGVTPAGSALDVTDLTVQLQQYGDYVTLTDKVDYIVEDNVLNEATDVLGQQMGRKCFAHVKPSLIDLDSQTHKGVGDRAQAEQYALAA